jgi:hypothetical protein
VATATIAHHLDPARPSQKIMPPHTNYGCYHCAHPLFRF